MAATGSPAALAGGVELLRRAFAYTADSLALVTPASLSAATPCADWDLGELLTHMNDSLLALHEASAVGRVNLSPVDDPAAPFVSGGRPSTELVRGLGDRACRMLRAWSETEGGDPMAVGDAPVSSSLVAAAGAIEVAVHGWDVAAARGQARPIPAPLAEDLLELAPLFVADTDRPGRFAPPAPVPAGAGPGDRLVAFLGRSPLRSSSTS